MGIVLREGEGVSFPPHIGWPEAPLEELAAAVLRFDHLATEAVFHQRHLPALGFAAIAAGVKSLVTNIISVRKEFEKYEAVLTNTLGSNKKAQWYSAMAVFLNRGL